MWNIRNWLTENDCTRRGVVGKRSGGNFWVSGILEDKNDAEMRSMPEAANAFLLFRAKSAVIAQDEGHLSALLSLLEYKLRKQTNKQTQITQTVASSKPDFVLLNNITINILSLSCQRPDPPQPWKPSTQVTPYQTAGSAAAPHALLHLESGSPRTPWIS